MSNLIIGKREAITNWIRQFSTIVDIDTRSYKIQEGIFGLYNWGEFKPLPKVDYVLIFRTLFAKCEECSIEEDDNNPNAYYQVSLVYNKNRRIIVQETRKKNDAFELGKQMSKGLNTRLKDSASKFGKSTWII